MIGILKSQQLEQAESIMVTYYGLDSNGDHKVSLFKSSMQMGQYKGDQVMFEATGVTNGNDTGPQITAVGTLGSM